MADVIFSQVAPVANDSESVNCLCKAPVLPSKACCGCGGPCCTCADLESSSAGLRYQTGEQLHSETDIAAPFFDHSRAFNASRCGNVEEGQGMNWMLGSIPYLTTALYNGTTYLVVARPAGQSIWVKETTGGGPSSGSSYELQWGVDGHFEHDSTNGLFKLCMSDGSKLIFNDFDQGDQAGMFESMEAPGGGVISVDSYTGNRIDDIRRSVKVDSVTTIQSMLYTYDSNDRLDKVTYRTKVGAGSWEEHRRAEYAYYGTSESYGNEGDLKTVKRQVPDGVGGWTTTHTSYYRYYKDGDADGRAHLLKFVVGPEAYQRLDDAVADPLTATNAQVADKADLLYKYDSLSRVTEIQLAAGSRTHSFSYQLTDHTDDENNWKVKCIETRPDNSNEKRYMNFLGQSLIAEKVDGNDSWVRHCEFNNDYHVTQHAHPSAFTSIDDRWNDLDVTLKSSDGKIDVYTYYTTTGNGALEGELEFHKIKKGTSGTEIKLSKTEYVVRTVGDCSIHKTSKSTVYRNDDGTGAIDTSFDYTWHSGEFQVEQIKTTLPAVSTSQNGSGTSNERYERFDADGRMIWSKDERGFISRTIYDEVTGSVSQSIQDVDTTQTSDEPSGWSTPSGGGKHLVTDFEFDDLGRTTQVLGPEHEVDISGTATDVRRASWTVLQDDDREVWSAQGYATGAQWDTYTLVNPVSIEKMDRAGRSIESIVATRASTSGKLSSSDSFAQSSYVRWNTSSYNDESQLENSRVYHDIPSSGAGSSGTNYDQSDVGYDASGRQNKSKTPGGTITRTVFDSHGRSIKVYVGTDDTSATDSDPTGGGATGNDMVIVSESQFDSGNDGGDGMLTKSTQHVDSSTKRETTFAYNWRGQRTGVDGEVERYVEYTYDNLDRVTRVDQKDTTSSGNLVARSESSYDDMGRVYQAKRFAVDKSTGTVGNALVSKTWFNESGAVIKQQAGGTEQFQKTEYDSLRRAIKQFVGFDTDESLYADADDVTGDTIFEQQESDFDDAGNVIETRMRQRHHDATGTGELTTPSGSNPKARVSYVAHYSDAVGRSIAVANYGTNADSALTRSSTVPTRSDSILVSETEYNDDGEAFKTIDPASKEDRVEFDDAGRVTKQIENYTDGNPTTGGSDEDVTVEFTYNADGQRATIVAKQSSASDDQTTTYVHGTTLTDSDIARSDLLRAVIYPDSDDASVPLGDGTDTTYDRVEYKYNRQGQRTEIKDQNGSVHDYDYDDLGRLTHDRVTTLGIGVDGAVRRLTFAFDERGQLDSAKSYDNATVGSGSVVNEVVREYNDMAMLVKEYQEHEGAKDANTLYVGYSYDETAASSEFTKGLRLKSMEYPNGRLVHYTYGSSGSDADNLNRLDAIKDDNSGSPGNPLVSYECLGLSRIVIEDFEEPDIKLDYFGGTSGSYAGFDRFGHVIDQRWVDYGSSTDLVRHKIGYDRASNPVWIEDTVLSDKDEYFTYDGLIRPKNWDRGTLNAGKTEISSTPKKEEDWTLDPLGNWENFVQKTDGSTDLDQDRTHNKANEIDSISETTGPSWADPAHDRNGNMTTIPRPADPTGSLTLKFDAWNRLVQVKDGSTVIGVYEYDSLMRRVKRHFDSDAPDSPDGIDTYEHMYFSSAWQELETRETNAESNQPEDIQPTYQWVWSSRYVDALILRDHNTDQDGLCDDDRLYFVTGYPNLASVVALTDKNGDAIERYAYSTHGQPTILNGGGTIVLASTAFDNRHMFMGHRRDSETGVYSFRTRAFHPQLGRFASRDPMGYLDSSNLYAIHSVVKNTDPFGLFASPIDTSAIGGCRIERHHWFPRQLEPHILRKCKGFNIHWFTTPLLRCSGIFKRCDAHGWLHNHDIPTIGKRGTDWNNDVRETLNGAPSCCAFLLTMWNKISREYHDLVTKFDVPCRRHDRPDIPLYAPDVWFSTWKEVLVLYGDERLWRFYNTTHLVAYIKKHCTGGNVPDDWTFFFDRKHFIGNGCLKTDWTATFAIGGLQAAGLRIFVGRAIVASSTAAETVDEAIGPALEPGVELPPIPRNDPGIVPPVIAS